MKNIIVCLSLLFLLCFINSCKNTNSSEPIPTSIEKPYWAGGVQTIDSMKYGRFVVRMRSMRKSGVISSFFSYHSKNKDLASYFRTNCEEIDIELVDNLNNVKNYETNYHYGEWNLSQNKTTISLNYPTNENFHIYSFEWTRTSLAWYVDDILVRKESNSDIENNLKNDQYILMNIWTPDVLNMFWSGVLNDVDLPVEVDYDWVRYYAWDETSGFSQDPKFIDDFNSFDSDKWVKTTWTWNGCNADFVTSNVKVNSGFLTLWLTKRGSNPPSINNTNLFKVTSNKYTESDDLGQAVIDEFGNNYRIADWNDVVSYCQNNSVEQFNNLISWKYQDNLIVTKDNTHYWSNTNRHYFITRFDHNLQSNYLSHANIDNHYIDLGSWYGLRLPILCFKKD